MRAALQLAKRHPKTSVSAGEASAAVPSSGIALIDNSQGASVAATQLSTHLGDALEHLDLDGKYMSFHLYFLTFCHLQDSYEKEGEKDK